MRNIGQYIQCKPKRFTVSTLSLPLPLHFRAQFLINYFQCSLFMYPHSASIYLQKLVSAYYSEYGFDDLVNDLMSAKEVGDEFTLMLAAKWLRRNITVITSKKDWSVYTNCPHDIVVTYKGKDRFMRGKWASSQLASRGAQPKNKSASK